MTAALVFGENLAAAVVALMYAGGQYLEGLRRAAGPARDDGAAGARAAQRHALSRRRRSRRCRSTPIAPGDRLLIRTRRRRAGRRHGRGQGVAVLDQSALTGEVAAGALRARRAGDERLDQCGRRLRPHRDAQRRRQHLCRASCAWSSRPSARRRRWRGSPTASRMVFLAVTVGDRRGGLDPQRRSDPGRRGAGGGDAVSADPRGAGGAGRRAVAGGAGAAS